MPTVLFDQIVTPIVAPQDPMAETPLAISPIPADLGKLRFTFEAQSFTMHEPDGPNKVGEGWSVRLCAAPVGLATMWREDVGANVLRGAAVYLFDPSSSGGCPPAFTPPTVRLVVTEVD